MGKDNESVETSTESNVIYFRGTVNSANNGQLEKAIDECSIEMKSVGETYGIPAPPIRLHISSYGGNLLDAFSTIEAINRSQVPVYTYVDGYAASAATLLSIQGDKRYIGENSYMLIHQLSGVHWGKFSELKDDMANSKKFMKHIYRVYQENTKLSKKQLKKMLKKDLWFNARECLEYGLVDEILCM